MSINSLEKYILYPNEPIDKLTVNRVFQRMYEDIDKNKSNSSLTIDSATENSYGKAKFTSLDDYHFYDDLTSEDDKEEYSNSILNIPLIKEFANNIDETSLNYNEYAEQDGNKESVSDYRYWLRTNVLDTTFKNMPNGILSVNCTFGIGITNIVDFIGTDKAYTDDVLTPKTKTSYNEKISITQDDYYNFTDYIKDNSQETESEKLPGMETELYAISNFDGNTIKIPFVENTDVILKHHICNYTTYSSYSKSYVEMHISSYIDIADLYSKKSGETKYIVNSSSETKSTEKTDGSTLKHKNQFFTQRPIIMGQIGFYTDDSIDKPVFGYDGRKYSEADDRTDFKDYNTVSLTPISTIDVNGTTIPSATGSIIIKKFENEYDDYGNIIDNKVYFDTIIKFSVGSAADPKMIYEMDNFNAKAKIQFALIGV